MSGHSTARPAVTAAGRIARVRRGGIALGALLLAQPLIAQEHPIRVTVRASAGALIVRPGDTVRVALHAEIPSGWHLYSLTQPPGGPIATTITAGPSALVRVAGAIESPVPLLERDPNFGINSEWFEDTAQFRVPLRIASSAAAGRHDVELRIEYQTCTNRYCLPPREDTLHVVLVVRGAMLAGSGALDAAPPTPPAPAPLQSRSGSKAFVLFLWLAATMGALSLLTPCVFPMVPITISYFSRRGPGTATRAQAVGDAVLYAGGIVGAFTGLGIGLSLLLGVAGLNRFAANPWLNLGIAALFILFALSLFGVLHLALPHQLLTWLDRASNGTRFGRATTTLLMGVTFALTTFTCTAPFVGTLLVSATRGDWRWPAAGLVAFSSVFALPFLVLALVPHALSRLPRSGEWLATLKGTLAFIELGAALKFLSNADLVQGWDVFTRQAVVAAWVALGVLLALYLAGTRVVRWRVRVGQRVGARVGERVGERAGAHAYPVATLAVLAASALLATGLTGRRLGELESFLPPAGKNLDGVAGAGELQWVLNDFDGGLAEARARQRLVLVDFTGYTCTNCRWMEANMFPRAAVARELERFVRVRLFTDGRGERYRAQQALEEAKFHTVALPLYAIVDAEGNTRATFLGMTRDTREFVEFLTSGRGAP